MRRIEEVLTPDEVKRMVERAEGAFEAMLVPPEDRAEYLEAYKAIVEILLTGNTQSKHPIAQPIKTVYDRMKADGYVYVYKKPCRKAFPSGKEVKKGK